MTTLRSDFLRILQERGFIHQCTDLAGLDALVDRGAVSAYIGFDATADSLHVGSLLQIMTLRWLQKTGGRPIVLMGGGTTKIGDPSFKDEARPLLDAEAIERNIEGIKQSFAKFLSFGDGPTDAVMVNNADWLDALEYVPFLRDVGRHFTINRMLGFDSVKLRLDREQPLTFLEFNYMILQAYDFLELNRRHDCRLQIGGSDQWGNIVNGIDLARRIAGNEVFGLTTPLIATASGEKMGKSVGGAVWLRPHRLSPYEYWQFWRNTEDADVGRFLKLFTDMPLDEIARLEALQGADINDAKKILATEATRLCHGDAAAEQAAETARETFEAGKAAEGLPTIDVPRTDLQAGIVAFRLFPMAGLASSNGEARRLIAGGGARLNDVRLDDAERVIGLGDVNPDGVIKLSAGKKRHALVRAA